MNTNNAVCATKDPRLWDPITSADLVGRMSGGEPEEIPRIREAIRHCKDCPVWQECLRVGITENRQRGLAA